MIEVFFYLTIVITILVALFCIDDLFIDFVALFRNLKPHKLTEKELSEMHNMPQKRIAIMVANWHEEDIIGRMIAGNVGRIDYQKYNIFLGVYPNDVPTIEACNEAASKYPNVQVIINRKPGPTSKGQMLNEIVRQIQAFEVKHQVAFDAYMLHDSEDIIHTYSLKLINRALEKNDFVQIPVFSLPTPIQDLTRGTYIDEFTESHTKDMLVRSYFKAGVPSAGVGTAMSSLFVREMQSLQNGDLMKEDTLTEDYHLGMMARRLGYDSEFVCAFRETKKRKDYIATREFFPASTATSIRQKTRWTLGISLQGYKNLGWGDDLIENYFLWRDRRGLFNAPLIVLSYLLFFTFICYFLAHSKWPTYITDSQLMTNLFIFNFTCMSVRLLQRFRLVATLNGYHFIFYIPFRWVLANYINTMATFKAVTTYYRAVKKGETPKWVKTTHELPAHFGDAHVGFNHQIEPEKGVLIS